MEQSRGMQRSDGAGNFFEGGFGGGEAWHRISVSRAAAQLIWPELVFIISLPSSTGSILSISYFILRFFS